MREGLAAEYGTEEALVAALVSMRARGYERLDALTPFASDRVLRALEPPPSPIPRAALAGAIVGACGAYAGLYWTSVVDQAWNVGGRPAHAVPAFVPITFEALVLGAVLGIAVALLRVSGLPRTSHPLLRMPGISRVTDDRFFLVVDREDDRFDAATTRHHLEESSPLAVREFGGGA